MKDRNHDGERELPREQSEVDGDTRLEGRSLLPAFRGESAAPRTLFWEHEGHRAVRDGRWKLVARKGQPWELYDIEADRAELHDLSAREPERVSRLADAWAAWAARCSVVREAAARAPRTAGARATD